MVRKKKKGKENHIVCTVKIHTVKYYYYYQNITLRNCQSISH